MRRSIGLLGSDDAKGCDRADPHSGASSFKRIVPDLLDVDDEVSRVVEVEEVGRLLFAESVTHLLLSPCDLRR
jgi:hypothetical protein